MSVSMISAVCSDSSGIYYTQAHTNKDVYTIQIPF